MKFDLFYPVKPSPINQPFGADPEYYAKFKDNYGNPQKGHMGIDFGASHGQPVYAACDGQAYFVRDAHGGEGIYILTGEFPYENTTCHFGVINWHLCGDTDPKYPSPLPLDGSKTTVKAGDLIGYADNSGAPYESSGDHLHFGLFPANQYGQALYPANGFGGCIDAQPFFNGFYAVDAPKVLSKFQQIINLLKSFLGK